MLTKDLVELWMLGRVRKISIDEKGATVSFGGRPFRLTGEQIGAAFAELGKTENDLRMFLIKQGGWQGREGAFTDAMEEKGLSAGLDFPFIALIGLIGVGVKGYTTVKTAKQQRKTAEKAAEAQREAARTGIITKVRELATIQNLALIGAVAAVGIAVVMKKRSRKT